MKNQSKKFLRRILGYLQPRMVMVFLVLLFTSFAMVGIAFNFSVNRYISSGAAYALSDARARYEQEIARETGMIMRVLRGNHRFEYANVRVFAAQSDFHPRELLITPDALKISATLSENQPPLVFTEGKRLRVDDRIFYISIVPAEFGALIFYLNVSDTLMFTTVVNRLLLVSVAMILLVSMIIAGVLADFTMKPLRVLRDFVRQIGRGDFTPNTYSFANEEFNELNQSLNNAVRQLTAYDNDQKTFFQNVSHELRTPLMSIKMYAEGIKYKVMDAENASETILQATNRLAGMVDDILYISRIESIPPPMEAANLHAIIEERVRLMRPMVEGYGLKIILMADEGQITVNCAISYIERAVDNLISNAMRYAESTIVVECYAIGGSATIRVTDDGPGFDPEEIHNVFERFYHGKNGLSGIGLATVKSIVDQHGGLVYAKNSSKKGAIMTISIPRLI